jgi:hypothetical protein
MLIGEKCFPAEDMAAVELRPPVTATVVGACVVDEAPLVLVVACALVLVLEVVARALVEVEVEVEVAVAVVAWIVVA